MRLWGNETPIYTCGKVRALSLGGKFLLDQAMQVLGDRWMIKALDDFIQKTGDQQALADFGWDSPRAKVKELVFFDLTGCSPVGATDVVGKDFETGH